MEARLKGFFHRFQLHHPPIRSRREIKEFPRFSREIMRIIRRGARAQDRIVCVFTWSLEGFSAPPSWKNKRFTSWNGGRLFARRIVVKKKKKEKKICKSSEDAQFFLVPSVVRKRLATGESWFLSLSLSCSFHSLLSFLLFLLSLFPLVSFQATLADGAST